MRSKTLVIDGFLALASAAEAKNVGLPELDNLTNTIISGPHPRDSLMLISEDSKLTFNGF
jgi:hypothetical protein